MNDNRFWKMMVMGSAILVLAAGPALAKKINESYSKQEMANKQESLEKLARESYNRTIEGPFKNDLASLRVPSGQFSLKNEGITTISFKVNDQEYSLEPFSQVTVKIKSTDVIDLASGKLSIKALLIDSTSN